MRTKLLLVMSLCLTFALAGCSREKSIEGDWKASDAFEQKIDMTIADNKITIKTGKKAKKIAYTALENEDKNGVHYYCFTMDKQHYAIVFPDTKDHQTALFIKNDKKEDPYSGALVYVMNRSEQPDYRTYASSFFNN